MTMPVSPSETADASTGFPEVAFGHSADGFAVARVADTAFAMLPSRDGRFYLASGWRIGRPMEQWTRADFYGHSGELANEAAFRAQVLENAEHQREKRALGRREIRVTANTPSGVVAGRDPLWPRMSSSMLRPAIGGIHLSAARNRMVHPMLRAEGGWYEEDEAWAIVAITFPHLFTGFERRCAERTIKDSWPQAWEKIFGTILPPWRIPRERSPGIRATARLRLDRDLGDHLEPRERHGRSRRHDGRSTWLQQRGASLPHPVGRVPKWPVRLRHR